VRGVAYDPTVVDDGRFRLRDLLALYPISLLILTAVHVLTPQRSGPLALTQVFAIHMFLLAILLVPFARDSSARLLRLGLALLLVVGVARFGPEWVSVPPGDEPGTPIEVMAWNLEFGSEAGRDLARVLAATRADIVILQELNPDHADRIEASDPIRERFPHRILEPMEGVLGIGLLSVFPITAQEPLDVPVGLVADLDLGLPQGLTVISAHPLPPRYVLAATMPPIPIGYEPDDRDEALASLRRRTDQVLEAGQPLILLGDFNVAPTEVAYGELSRGLVDAHLETGLGPGFTWRPRQVEAIPAGMLRIDYVLAGGGLRPLGSSTDCSHPGDHCIVSARLLLP
jgi:endonuclease/exonuclease/phosphatase family metal-dependent hydrolase